MTKEKRVNTFQGILDIWEHDSGEGNFEIEQKYGSSIFNKITNTYNIKVHASANALRLYIDSLNVVTPL